MRISIDKKISIPIYIQIKNQIKELIHDGILPVGFVLPPERRLAVEIGVSRSTVVKAYEELKALGLVESHIGMGTRVSAEFEDKALESEVKVLPLSWYQFFDESIASANEHTISDIMNIHGHRNLISFAAGIAAPELYPLEKIKEIEDELWRISPEEILSISSVDGYYPLRESLVSLMETRRVQTSSKEIVILSGSMQGIDFAARTFIKPGDVVIVEEPTYIGALESFRVAGAKVIGVPMDNNGIRTDVLDILLQKYKPKFIYTMPNFQCPTGITMSGKRRNELLALAHKYQVPIVEDDPYGELRYEGTDLPTLKALDKHGYVIYISTFSKTLFSGMRIGWAVAPEQVIKKFSILKQMTDLHTNTLGQHILDNYLRKNYYREHIKLVCSEYTKKRDAMVAALEEYKVQGVNYTIPEGGYYIWCTMPKGISQSRLMSKAAVKGVIYTPGNVFFPHAGEGETYFRLNFTYENCENIKLGIKLLMEAIREAKEESEDSEDNLEFNKTPLI
ncbi:MAG: PLP-dependent aminotransferase family protein [Bacillota bacterium]|nr:PLP-dependent aminotransferase family protein [Bacillota bacterium]